MTAVGIIRLLDLFLCDIYKPRSTERKSHIYDLLKKGRFDMDIIREYFDNCRKEGTSFELLGEKKAFAQYAAGEIEAKERPIGFIIPTCKKKQMICFTGIWMQKHMKIITRKIPHETALCIQRKTVI